MHEGKTYVVTYAFFGFTIHHRGSKLTVARPCVDTMQYNVGPVTRWARLEKMLDETRRDRLDLVTSSRETA